MLAAIIGNLLLSHVQKYDSDFCNEPTSSGSFVCLCKTRSCVGLCLAWEKAPGEFDWILIGFFCLWSQLKTVETLLGNTAKVGEVIVLGMITQLKEVSSFLLWSLWSLLIQP